MHGLPREQPTTNPRQPPRKPRHPSWNEELPLKALQGGGAGLGEEGSSTAGPLAGRAALSCALAATLPARPRAPSHPSARLPARALPPLSARLPACATRRNYVSIALRLPPLQEGGTIRSSTDEANTMSARPATGGQQGAINNPVGTPYSDTPPGATQGVTGAKVRLVRRPGLNRNRAVPLGLLCQREKHACMHHACMHA